ncbi:MAG TPA: hypothetical protein VLD58_05535 [Gemmatimonadales bacterium]|nr:hypothetical protein [Gemmatimonadales bacterium]
MISLRRIHTRRKLGVCLLIGMAAISPSPARAQADTSGAAQAMRDYLAAARHEGGKLWGRSLLGPMILVDPATRAAFASEEPPGGSFRQRDGLWQGTLPDGIPLANFALTWVNRRWAMVLLPLPQDRFLALELLLHESYHGIQEQIGLARPDRLNPHLDERDGRYWLRLELRALGTALGARGGDRKRAAEDAMRFRAARLARYPGADTLENSLEVAEGLAEYTGTRVALDYLRLPQARAATLAHDFERRKTYVRSLGYGTGPGIGLLLDQYRPDWRTRVAREGLAPQLAKALGVAGGDDAARVAIRYGADSLGTEEDRRAEARTRVLADYRARLIDGPVLALHQSGVQRAFNPNELIPFGAEGTIYPTGTFSAEWGSLEVTRGGALIAPDYSLLRLQAPTSPGDSVVHGEGWVLKLAEGWRAVPGARAGDLTVRKQ